MKKKSKWLLLALSATLTAGIMTGCSNTDREKEATQPAVQEWKVVEETSIKVEDTEKLVTQNGVLNGFPENNLVEFKIKKDNKETLRVFQMGTDIYSHLSKEKPDGKTEFVLNYRESKDGITHPILTKIEKK
ncbi:hypothetical protein CVD28_04000 [Bacillus sp. M6-12]|uniref:hypothetical protein n=1 Tax=Bacillus sp. M6-12 TaxID=2054166 RepID=UPI000C791A20|nr:hypothetical protein [Bacillus sp. M6-12]PLS19589.1 hypothetical protein CVD28_04000 [Bacillus sp. M6-12]